MLNAHFDHSLPYVVIVLVGRSNSSFEGLRVRTHQRPANLLTGTESV